MRSPLALLPSLLALLFSAAAIACSSGAPSTDATVAPLVDGARDGPRHPAVVALVLQDAGGVSLCSGTLVAADVVLTARHCVSRLASDVVRCPSSDVQVLGDRDPRSISVVVTDEVRGAKISALGASIVAPKTTSLCDADLALLRLDRVVPGIEPMRIDEAHAHGSLVCETVDAVGYGASSDDRSSSGLGVRRSRSHLRVVSGTDHELVVAVGACGGDSGGPVIDEIDGAVLGVDSRGASGCDDAHALEVYTRVDAFLPLVREAIETRAQKQRTSGVSGANL